VIPSSHILCVALRALSEGVDKMSAVLEYTNRTGERKQRIWSVSDKRRFTALIKCYVQGIGEQKFQAIEKPSTRPASFSECCRYAEKMKNEYGDNLKKLIIWDVDALKENSNWL
jgi:hypothetical protein